MIKLRGSLFIRRGKGAEDAAQARAPGRQATMLVASMGVERVAYLRIAGARPCAGPTRECSERASKVKLILIIGK